MLGHWIQKSTLSHPYLFPPPSPFSHHPDATIRRRRPAPPPPLWRERARPRRSFVPATAWFWRSNTVSAYHSCPTLIGVGATLNHLHRSASAAKHRLQHRLPPRLDPNRNWCHPHHRRRLAPAVQHSLCRHQLPWPDPNQRRCSPLPPPPPGSGS